jgi:dihydropteroate synthase
MCFDTPKVMGVINITPDSFYAGARSSLDDLESRVDEMISEGADIIDIGATNSKVCWNCSKNRPKPAYKGR